MKKAKRIIGMVLLIVGGFGLLTGLISLWAVLTVRDVDYRLGSAIMVLIYVLFSVGIFTLGWRLRHPRNKASDAAQERPAPAKPVYDPPKPRKLTVEEKQRQEEEKAQRQRLWREQAEEMKKARMEALAPWRDIDPEEAEHIARGQYTLDTLLSLDIPSAEQGPGARKLRFDESLHQWRLTVQLDEERLWFLSVFVGEDGNLKKFSLDYEGAADSHYEFTAEKAIRDKLCAPGEEELYFHEILIRYVKEWGGNGLLTQIMPYVTAQFHYD